MNTFLYNGDGQRVQKTDSQGTTRFIYDGGTVIAEADTAGNITARYTPGVDYQRGPGGYYFYRENGIGNTLTTTDTNGALVSLYEYDAYGSTYGEGQSLGLSNQTPYLHAGKSGYYADYDSGMELLGRRYYLPKLGRFLTQDPAGQEAGLNLYEYVHNNPLGGVDPTGLDQDPVDQGIRNGFTAAGTAIGMWLGGGAGGAGGSLLEPGGGTAGGVLLGAAAGGLEGGIDGRLAGELAVGLRHLGNYLFDSISGGGGGGEEDPTFIVRQGGARFPESQLQHEMKHAGSFGFPEGQWSPRRGIQFAQWLQRFMDSPSTMVKAGTYRKMSVIHYFDPGTRLNVMTFPDGTFVGGWRLNRVQMWHLRATGNLGGG